MHRARSLRLVLPLLSAEHVVPRFHARRALYHVSSPHCHTPFHKTVQRRTFGTHGTTLTDEELASEMQEFQNLFVEARLCVEDARESLDTTYYEEDLEVAKEATEAATSAFKAILSKLDSERADALKRGNGMKVAQLEAELAEVAEHYKDDH